MSLNKNRSSVIIEEEEIFDPMANYSKPLPEAVETTDTTGIKENTDQYRADEIDNEVQSRTVLDTEEEPKQAEQALLKEETDESSAEDGVEVIAQGAICKCSMGKLSGNMNVISQSKVYCNGGSRLVATTEDKNLLSLSFGSCTAKNNAPCVPNISWLDYYEDAHIMGNLQVLTMNSKGNCQSGGGMIEFQTSGQSQFVSSQNLSESEREILRDINPLLRIENENSPAYEKLLQGMEEKINQEMEEIKIILEETTETIKGRVDKNTGIVPIKYPVAKKNGIIKQPKKVLCSFIAAKKGILIWKIRDENMQVIKEAEGTGTISVYFPKYGRYVIEAYGNSSTVKGNTQIEDIKQNSNKYFNTLLVDVCENEIILKADKEKWYTKGKVNIKAEKLFADQPPTLQNLNFQVMQSGSPVGIDKAEIVPTATGCEVTFREKGDYVVTTDRIGRLEVNPTSIIRIENIRVVSVKANGQATLKTSPNQTIEIDAQLNFEDADKDIVKWDFISPDGQKIDMGKPQSSDFKKTGTYKIYAYCAGRSENIKATVEINETKFLNLNWVDENNRSTSLIGARQKLYAHVGLEHAAGLEIHVELRNSSTDQKVKDLGSVKMKANRLVVPVILSEDNYKGLSNKQQLYIYLKLNDGSVVTNKNVAPKSYPISFSTAKDVTSLLFYEAKDCKHPLSIASYDSTIYAKVVTRNLKKEEIELKLVHDINWKIDDTLGTYKVKLNDDGVGIFEIKVKDGWAKKNGYWQKTIKYYAVISEVGGSAYKKELTLGTDAAAITFTDKPKNSEEAKVLTKIGKASNSNNKTNCSKCNNFTEDDFKALFPDVKSLFPKGTNSLTTTSIKDFADELNKAFNEFNIDNCNRKLHFLTQISCETGDFARIDENLNYSKTNFRNANWPESKFPDLYKNDAQSKFSNKPEALANYVYKNSGGNGNQASGDGYKYRGRGLLQLTFKNNYKLFEDYLVERDGIKENTILDDPELLLNNLNYMVRSAAWFWKYGKAGGTDRLDISKRADKGDIGKITEWTHGNRSTVPQRVDRYSKLMGFYDIGLCNFFMNHLATDCTIDYHIKTNTIEKYIPKGKTESEIFHYRYYYHDDSGIEYFLCAVMGYFTQKWLKGTKIAHSGNNWVKDQGKYFLKDGDNQCLLVAVPKTLEISGLFSYTENTVRTCANPDAYAVMLASLADTRYTDFYFNGFTDSTGKGAPSVSHINGINLDIRYLKTKEPHLPIYINTKTGWDVLDLDRHNIFMKKAYDRGFKQYYIMPLKTAFAGHKKSGWDQMCESLATTLGKNASDITNKIYLHGTPHEHHVHLQGFTKENIKTM